MADAPRAWASTRLGLVRTANEDRCRVGDWVTAGEDVDWEGTLPDQRPWVLVADGMGGHGAGEVASTVTIDAFDRLLSIRGPNDIRAIVDEVNLSVFKAMEAPTGRRGMGTTVVGMCVAGRRLTLFNVGDSRIYLIRDGDLSMISVDHTPIRKLGGHGRSHALTQSLGGTAGPVPLRPHVANIEVQEHDAVMLCSDGLTDMLSDAGIADVLSRSPSHPTAALAEAALEAGGRDNVTAVLVAW